MKVVRPPSEQINLQLERISPRAGVIKYVGAVDFAAGLWLGIELRSGKGKNDGAVSGRR